MIYSQYLNDKSTPKEGCWFPMERVEKAEYKKLLKKGQIFSSKPFKSIGVFISKSNYSTLPIAILICQNFKEDGIYTINQDDKVYVLVKIDGTIHPCSDKYYSQFGIGRLKDIFFNLTTIDISEKELDYETLTNNERPSRLLENLKILVRKISVKVKEL